MTYSHIYVPKFKGLQDGRHQDDALRQVIVHLDELGCQGHVARFIKQGRHFRVGGGRDSGPHKG